MAERTSRYIDPLNDVAFKRIFGTEPNKDLLIAFLNEVFRGRKHIVDLVYNKNEHHGDIKEEGLAIFDLLCTGDSGEQFIIELQRNRHANFKERALFYTSRLISEQAPRGNRKQWNYDLKAVYLIAILEDFSLEGNPNKDYLYDVCLCNMENSKIFYDRLGYTYVELSNFVKTEDKLESDLDKWLYLLKHLGQMDKIPAYLGKPVFEKLFNIAEYSNLTKEEKMSYDVSLKRKWDAYSALSYAKNEGIGLGMEKGVKKGIKLGMEKGEAKALLEVARKLKDINAPIDIIIKATGLSIEIIENL